MNLTKRTSLTALATLCGVAALGPAAASASRIVTYDVEVYGQADWNHQQQKADSTSSFGSGGFFSWVTQGDIGRVRFRDGYLESDVRGEGQEMATGKADAEYRTKGNPVDKGSCTLDGQLQPGGPMRFGKPDSAGRIDTLAAVAIQDTDVNLDWKCEGIIGPTVPLAFGSEPIDPVGDFGSRPLDAVFTVPREIVGFGQIIQNVEGPVGASTGYCPERWYEGVQKCTFDWKGTVTLTKVGEETVGDPPVPAPQTPQPGHPSNASDLEDLAPLVLPSSSASTNAKASAVSFTATCPSGCSGSAALVVPGAKAGAAVVAAAKPVARMAFQVRPSAKAQKVVLKVPAKGRRALRRAHRGSLQVTLKKPGKVAAMRTLKVKVPRR